jgi:uncharacterized protein with HEPN domain
MDRDQRILRDILWAIESAETNAAAGRDEFLRSPLMQDAVLFRLLVLGEAVGRLSDEIRNANPQVPWHRFRRFRNETIHNYNAIDALDAWDIVENILPALKVQIQALLQSWAWFRVGVKLD